MKNQDIEVKKIKITAIFGEEGQCRKAVEFDTEKEMEAYLQGIGDMDGWLAFDYEEEDDEDDGDNEGKNKITAREEMIDEMIRDDIKGIKDDLYNDDVSFLDTVLRGGCGRKQYSELSDEEIKTEYNDRMTDGTLGKNVA